jgi:Arc/MetJ-type ribon-helix-helix transcriptional regulator
MARITFSLPDELEPVIDERVHSERIPSVSAYICDLVTRDLTGAGLLKDDQIMIVRAKAAAAADLVGADKVLAALESLSADSYATEAAGGGK